MQIQIDSAAITQAVNESATEAITQAMSGFAMRHAIAGVITDEFTLNVIKDAVRQAVQNTDSQALANHLAAEMQQATQRAVSSLLNEGIVAIVCKLRGIPDYDKPRYDAVRQEMCGSAPVPPSLPNDRTVTPRGRHCHSESAFNSPSTSKRVASDSIASHKAKYPSSYPSAQIPIPPIPAFKTCCNRFSKALSSVLMAEMS